MAKSIKLIEKFCEGKTTPKETVMALHLMAIDPRLEQYANEYKKTENLTKVVEMRRDYDEKVQQQYGQFLPIYSMAAEDGNNLCDLQCENYILERYNIVNENQKLADEARSNYWLRDSGMPLYNMGRLMECNGLYVQRFFDATIEKLQAALDRGEHPIVVVNNGILEGKKKSETAPEPNHAIVVLKVEKESVTVYNPSTGHSEDNYPLPIFMQAWSTSNHYLVTARKAKEHEYNPQPINVEGVELSPELLELTETIAENAHDRWAIKRFSEGLVYGPKNIDGKTNKDLLPYYQLPDTEKEYDRDMAVGTIKLLVRLGYRIINVNKLPRCPHCGTPIEPHYQYCSFCGQELKNEDFVDKGE